MLALIYYTDIMIKSADRHLAKIDSHYWLLSLNSTTAISFNNLGLIKARQRSFNFLHCFGHCMAKPYLNSLTQATMLVEMLNIGVT